MLHIPDFIRCPVSREPLLPDGADRVVSASGAHAYPVVHGIIDLRLFDAPYMDRAHELSVANQLADAASRLGYDDLIRHLETDLLGARRPERIAWGIEHRLSLRHRAPDRLRQMIELIGGIGPTEGATMLDLGCGSGEAVSGLMALGAGRVVGIDISLVELILGRKLLEEAGIEATLVAGCAESLPFSDDLFDFIFSPDVIEHVTDQSRYLREARRVLKPGGQVLMNSPNRFSLMAPEPHVGIWGLTLLPRAWVSPVCELLGKGPYIGKRLVSLGELRRLLSETFEGVRILGRPANPDATSLPGKLYAGLAPASERLIDQICPEHTVLARRAGPTET